jgi:LPXTG-motif cell wall-anchored protein
MSRIRAGFVFMAMVAALTVPVLFVDAGVAAADVPITTVCTTTTAGTVITLTANCTTTEALTVPNGFTLNGANHTITATNPPAPATTYSGAVVTNAAGAASMNIENLTVTGPATGFPFPLPQPSCLTSGGPNGGFPGLFGIFFNDAGGTVNNVKVMNIFQTNTAPGSPACNTGHAIRADSVAARTVTITNTTVSGYQKAGMFASGNMTMNVSASTIGPPSFVPFSIAQNGVQWTNTSTNSTPPVGASGSIKNSTINGSSFVSTKPVDPASGSSTAVLLFGSRNVTVDHNTITGGSDIGISVTAASTNTVVSFNAINRPTPPTPDTFGIGVHVTTDSEATTRLICNTFSGWMENIVPATLTQEACPPPPTTTTTTTASPTTTAPTTAPTTAAPTTVPSVAPTGELPATGSDSKAPLYVGGVLIMLGTLVVTITTRRRVRRS